MTVILTNKPYNKNNFKGGSCGTSLPLFTPIAMDHVLSFEETRGYALQGTYVYKTGVAGERYGYPDFIQKCLDEKTAGTETQVTLGESAITMYTNANGHQYYNIADKAVVDAFYDTYGVAWFYGIDQENERVFLPRNDWFEQMTGDVSKVGQFNPAGLPNITGDTIVKASSDSPSGGTATINPSGAFKVKSGGKRAGINGGSYYTLSVYEGEMDASLSSPVYGNSETVQPPSVNKLLYIVVGDTSELTHVTTTIPDSEVISQVNKNTADIINKLGREDRAEIINWSIPDYTAGVSKNMDVEYTAETPGWLIIMTGQSNSGAPELHINGVKVCQGNAQTNQRTNNTWEVPIGAGDTYIFKRINTNTTEVYIHFYPMKGVTNA